MRRLYISLLCCALVLVASPALAQTTAADSARVAGAVVDVTGSAVPGANVRLLARDGRIVVASVTDAAGRFSLPRVAGSYDLSIEAPGFLTARAPITSLGAAPALMTLELAGVTEAVNVEAAGGYRTPATRTATRTPAPLRDVPQAVSIVTRGLIADQAMLGIGDVVRYMPGVGIAQGEGNRDTPILRGQATTGDFFVDGVRDDVQYVRDLYNVERVEAIKGPNAMVFGRGGAGGVINRVTRQADWVPQGEVRLQMGSWDQRRLAGDAGWTLSPGLAARATGVYEDSGSYRDGVEVRRYGVNPTVAARIGSRTVLRAGYEYFHDERTADRGVPSVDGAPLVTTRAAFFGDPSNSPVRATISVGTLALEHSFGAAGSLRNRLSVGHYDKFYQNVFPGAVNAAAQTVQISAYNSVGDRTNIFNQTDLVLAARTGRVAHTWLFGAELGRQVTDNFRSTGYFTSVGPSVTSVAAPLARPTISLPLEFRQSATDADNQSVATTASVYVQDQLRLTEVFDIVAGIRFDRFQLDLTDNRTRHTLSSTDGMWSPRAGLIYRPAAPVSLYASHSRTYVPRAGDQLSSLTASTQSLEPESFRNYEVGATWDVTRALSVTAAAYRLDRGNVAVTDPLDPRRRLLVDAQRSHGLEVGITGHLSRAWSVAGGYALQEGEITRSLSSSAEAGASLAQLPRHSLALWNKYQVAPRVGLGLGVIHRGTAFTSTDNRVVMPSFTRADGGVFIDINDRLRAQLNAENIFDAHYFASAHSNTNITPGAPRALRVALTVRR